MEWVEASGKSLGEARETALDLLGVAEDDAEFVVLSEPKAGLFGRVRGEARVQARVRPMAPPPKRGRRQRPERKGKGNGSGERSERQDGRTSSEGNGSSGNGSGEKRKRSSGSGEAKADSGAGDESDMQALQEWIRYSTDVPTGKWFKDFGSFKLCGEGERPSTFLTAEQIAEGQELD